MPVSKSETMSSYAKKLSYAYDFQDSTIVGLSFGGMIAVELSKFVQVNKLVVISSVKGASEIPWYYKISRVLPIHLILPTGLLKSHSFFTNWLFGIKDKSDKLLLAEILKDTDPKFLRWALNQIVYWRNTVVPNGIVHIHGRQDRILPAKFVKVDYLIEGGGHLMIVNKSSEINAILGGIL